MGEREREIQKRIPLGGGGWQEWGRLAEERQAGVRNRGGRPLGSGWGCGAKPAPPGTARGSHGTVIAHVGRQRQARWPRAPGALTDIPGINVAAAGLPAP